MPLEPPSITRRILVKSRWAWARLVGLLSDGRYRFRDRFGVTHYVWHDTRLADTLERGVRIDDEGLLFTLHAILDRLDELRGAGERPRVAFDIGAFIGVVSLHMATRFRTHDRVFAFEAFPPNAARVRDNVALNALGNVVVVEAAMSDAPRRDRLRNLSQQER